MKYLIAGLGNIGTEYAHTRHNIGFEILDFLAGESGIFFTPGRYGDVAELKFRGRHLILLKPSTYMNLSGKAVDYWLKQEKIPLERFLVVTDDLALPFGKIRIRAKGSDGGHNGLKNINEILGSTDYTRLRFGIGDDFHKGKQVDYVLSKWSSEEEEKLPKRLKICADAIKSFSFQTVARTMSDFNHR
jgi:PTH1 family peptidyl-tRNA hydrolase